MAQKDVRDEVLSARDEALGNQRLDYLVTALRGVASAVPFGSLVVETVTSVIPRQRMDRVADMIGRLGAKLDQVEAAVEDVRERFKSAEFIDLFEEGVLQAGKALSEERRQHIASILFHGLTDQELNHARVKKLLFLLNDLADPEIVWLTYVNLAMDESQEQFYQLHEKVLEPVAAVIGADRRTLDEAALQKAYQNRLVQLGLASERLASPNDVTSLGRMLLRYIDAPRDWDVEETTRQPMLRNSTKEFVTGVQRKFAPTLRGAIRRAVDPLGSGGPANKRRYEAGKMGDKSDRAYKSRASRSRSRPTVVDQGRCRRIIGMRYPARAYQNDYRHRRHRGLPVDCHEIPLSDSRAKLTGHSNQREVR